MNIMKIISLVQAAIAEGEQSILVQDLKHIAIQTIDNDANIGYDRAEIIVMNLFKKIGGYLTEKEII